MLLCKYGGGLRRIRGKGGRVESRTAFKGNSGDLRRVT